MTQYLYICWTGEHFLLWASEISYSRELPIEKHQAKKESLDPLLAILKDQDLVQFEQVSSYIKVYSDLSLTVPLPYAIKLSAIGFIDLITSFKDEIEEAGYVFSESVLFWKHASKVLLDALARGLFFPSITHKSSYRLSQWELYVHDESLQIHVGSLSKKMPLISNQIGSQASADQDAFTVEDFNKSTLYSFIKIGIDQIIRSFLSTFSLLKNDKGELQTVIHKKDVGLAAWIQSLCSPQSRLELGAVDLSLLERKVLDWNERLRGRIDEFRPRVTIEVIAPLVLEGEDAFQKKWYLQTYFDTSDDAQTSVLTEIDEYKKIELFDYLLLKDTGRLQQIIPFFSAIVEQGVKEEYAIEADQAYDILEKYRKQLEEEQFIVKQPAWWDEAKKAVGIVIKINSKDDPVGNDSPFKSTNLVDFSWKLTIGNQELSLEQFEAMLEQGRSLMFIGGTWVGLDKNEIKDNILKLKSISSSQKFTLFDALRLGVSGLTGMSQLDLVRIDADGWIQKILDFSTSEGFDTSIPDIFKGELRPYQSVGVSWLSFLSQVGVGGCLADDMGLGKTVQVLALLAKEHVANPHLPPNLLVVPMSIVGNWEAEAKKFVPTLSVYVHHGAQRLIGESFYNAVKGSHLVVTTYNLLHRDYKHFRKIDWYRVILDEAQNIKNTDAKQTKAIRALVDELSRGNAGVDADKENFEEIDSLALPNQGRGPLRLALTGTPLENRLQELWSILDFVNPGLLGSSDEFRKQFVNPIEKSREMAVANSLGRLIKPFILRRVKTDPEIAADLPEKIEMESFVHLTAEQAALYSATLEQMMPRVRELDGIHRKGMILSVITKLKQICIHPSLALRDGASLAGRSGKLQVLEELLDTILAEGDRVLIFTQFAQWGQMLCPYLSELLGLEIPFFHGGLNRGEREKIVARFQDDAGPPILVLSLKAGGFGLNLTRANQVIHLDQWWNPAVQNQATDRAYRIGQKSTVQVRSLISKGTLEEKINQLHKDKLELANAVVGTTRNVITELSPEALEELLSLQSSVLLEA